MKIIVNGREFSANWCWQMGSGRLMFEIEDYRPLYEIARDFESAEEIIKISKTEGDATYKNNGRVIRLIRPDAKPDFVQVTIERS